MINFLKGIIVGIFNIIPGLSGCAMLVIFNLYEDCIYSISTFYKNPKEKFLYLFPIALGIILGTYLFSNIILFLLNSYYVETYTIFTILILCTIPNLFKETIKKGFKPSYLIPFFIAFFIGTIFIFLDIKDISYNTSYSFLEIIKYLFIGIILSISTIIPGISSTVLLSLFSLYGIYIYSISTLNIFVLLPITIGFIITTFYISKLINYLLTNYYSYTYFAILGFCLSTIFCFIKVII